MEKFLSQRKKKTIMAALILGLCFSVSGYVHATNASEFETPEYFASSGLDVINAAGAYARGYTGQGITIGISDLPVNLASPEFNTKKGSAYVSGSYVNYIDKNGISYSVADRSYWQYVSHGTHVAGIAAASRNGLGMHGVAFDAQVASATAYDCYDEREGRNAGAVQSGYPGL